MNRASILCIYQLTPPPAPPLLPPPKPPKPPPELPPLEQLTPDSDFRPFLNPKVDEDTRRAALKKLFADSR